MEGVGCSVLKLFAPPLPLRLWSQMVCPAGKFSAVGAITGTYCALCPAGTYSVGAAAACSLCPPGTFGNATQLTSVTCSGACAPGYMCPAGSTNSTSIICPVGRYSLGSAGACAPCPRGRYGSTTGLRSANCTAVCNAGSRCPLGSATPTTGGGCSPGSYSRGPNSTTVGCVPCPAATPYSLAGATSASACTNCSTGCTLGVHGVLACPSPAWAVWLDVGGVEGNNSCLQLTPAPIGASGLPSPDLVWSSLVNNSHLLTAQQVRGLHFARPVAPVCLPLLRASSLSDLLCLGVCRSPGQVVALTC